MKTIFKHILLGVLVLCGRSLCSQTVNMGDLYITAGTNMSTLGLLDNKSTGNLLNDGDLYVYDHYNNDGISAFTIGSKSGTTYMRGISGYQSISGSVPIEWYNVEFSNNTTQPAFHLSNEVSVSGVSNFKQGIVDDNLYNGLLIFEKGANAINVSDASHVDGFVQKNGDDAFQFPIGANKQFRYNAISSSNNNTNVFKSKYFFENSDLLYPHANKPESITLINNQEYWTINRLNGDGSVLITLTWDEDTTSPSIYSDPVEEIHIVRWDSSKKLWVDQGGAVNVGTKEVTTVVPSTDYGVFTLARVVDKDKSSCANLVFYNAVSPNGDNKNDYFKIDGLIDCAAENTLEIYNRWGVKVYETKNYGSNENVFKGYSEGRTTIAKKEFLPTGTYFYILYFKKYDSQKMEQKTGYLYLSR